ncbi:MAG: creatininase family protein [Myxococcales bacterium]|nr:creatininase family protein [Myxococcales bacterium]
MSEPAPTPGAALRAVDPFDLPHAEAARLLADDVPIYLPVNPVEYHGPHLSLHNDHLVSLGLGADLHAALGLGASVPWLVAASLEAGVEPCPGPGSRATPYRELRRMVVEACEALAGLGARRVVLLTFHGAPLHALALDAGVRVLEARGARAIQPLNVLMHEMLSFDPGDFAPAFAHVADEATRAAMIAGLPGDFHAGFFETSMALHYAPRSVAPLYRELPPCPAIRPDPALATLGRLARAAGRERLARELDFGALGRGWGALDPFPGYTGQPRHATAAAGRLFATHIVSRYAATARAVFHGAPTPRPIMRWVEWLSLGGAIPGLPPPRAARAATR